MSLASIVLVFSFGWYIEGARVRGQPTDYCTRARYNGSFTNQDIQRVNMLMSMASIVSVFSFG